MKTWNLISKVHSQCLILSSHSESILKYLYNVWCSLPIRKIHFSIIWSINLVMSLFLGIISSLIRIICPGHLNLLFRMSFFYFIQSQFQSYVRFSLSCSLFSSKLPSKISFPRLQFGYPILLLLSRFLPHILIFSWNTFLQYEVCIYLVLVS